MKTTKDAPLMVLMMVCLAQYVGRWSRLAAREFLIWLDIPAGSKWLDVGCGTGALTQMILQVTTPRQVKGLDQSGRYIAHAREQVQDSRVHFEVGMPRRCLMRLQVMTRLFQVSCSISSPSPTGRWVKWHEW